MVQKKEIKCKICLIIKKRGEFPSNGPAFTSSGKKIYRTRNECKECYRKKKNKEYYKKNNFKCACGLEVVLQYNRQHMRSKKHFEHLKQEKCYNCNKIRNVNKKFNKKYECQCAEFVEYKNIVKNKKKKFKVIDRYKFKRRIKKFKNNFDNCHYCKKFLNKELMTKYNDVYICHCVGLKNKIKK